MPYDITKRWSFYVELRTFNDLYDEEHNMRKCPNLEKHVNYPPSGDGRLFGIIKQI